MLPIGPSRDMGLILESLILPGLMTFFLKWGQHHLLHSVIKCLAHSRGQQLLLSPGSLQEKEARMVPSG